MPCGSEQASRADVRRMSAPRSGSKRDILQCDLSTTPHVEVGRRRGTHQLLGGQVEQVVEVNATVGELAESALLLELKRSDLLLGRLKGRRAGGRQTRSGGRQAYAKQRQSAAKSGSCR